MSSMEDEERKFHELADWQKMQYKVQTLSRLHSFVFVVHSFSFFSFLA